MANKKEPPTEAGPKSPSKWKEPEQYSRDPDLAKPGAAAERDVLLRTPDGHSIVAIGTKGKETFTFQHRTGAGFSFGPTGDVKLTAHNGQYQIVFGENRTEITGTNDITVRGGGTLKVDGDYDCTIGGNMNFSVTNDINFKGKAFNVAATGNMDITAQNMTMKTAGSAAIHAEGAMALTADGSVGLASRTGAAMLAGATQVGIVAASGEVAIQSGGNVEINSGGDVNADAGGKFYLQSGKSKKAEVIIKGDKAKVPTKQTTVEALTS